MKTVQLTFTQVESPIDQSIWYDSNLIQVNGASGIHIEMPDNGKSNSVTIFRSITGMNPISCYQDYFTRIFDKDLLHIDIGYKYIGHISEIGVVLKFRLSAIPDYACIRGEIEDLGPADPDNPGDIQNAFAGSEGVYFQDIDSEYLVGRSRSLNLNPNY